MLYKDIVKKISVNTEKKLKQKEYLKKGLFEVVDQGQSLVGGFSNDSSLVVTCDLPVIVFGDHTKCVKFIDFPFIAGADGVKVLQAKECVDAKFLYYYTLLLTKKMIDKGYARHYQFLEKMKVEIPSADEQKRIVNKIEELFSELDSAVETLKKTKEQLAVYRQSVLSTAIGQSEECRQMHIEELLVKNRKGMTTGPFGTMIKKSDHRTSGHPMLGIENIGRGKFCDGNKIFVTDEKAKELEKYRVKRGDVIISRSGTVGEICEIPQRAENALISTNLIRISLDENVVLSQYFIYLFQTQGSVLKQVKELCKGSTRPFLTQGILKDIIFPIPTIKKQRQIISQIESQLTLSENIEKTINDALIQADAMRQSILKKAFEGEL